MITIQQTDACQLLKSLEPESVQVVITDPPYGIAYHSNHYKDGNPHAPVAHDWNFQIGPFLSQVARVLAPGGALYLFTRWDVYPLWHPSVLKPLEVKNLIVWEKDNWSAGDLSGNFGNQYELLMFIPKGRHKLRGHRHPNIWRFPRIPAKKLRMPAEKPVELIQRAIESSSDVGGLVVDPFCGSGTTGAAARALGRTAVLGDIDPLMIKVSCDRLNVPYTGSEIETATMPDCPIFRTQPPAPHLWGLHPEDLAYALEISKHAQP